LPARQAGLLAPDGEDELIASIGRKLPPPGPGVVLGIGDDCAIFRAGREDLLLTTDMTLEGVHFLSDAHPPAAVGWRTLARGLSDIAAMGGEPRLCLLSLALAPGTDRRWIDGFYRGLLALARESGVTLAGGDLSHAERLAADIVVVGSAPRGKALRRDGGRPGDAVYVSGTLGGSALGLATRSGAAWRRHLKPQPRLALGRFLRERLRATAAMDVSDGLALDLHRLSAASGCAAELERVPVFRGATLEQALSGGEDYELLVTVGPRAKVPASFDGVALTPIGRLVEGRRGEVRFEGGVLPPRGYDHLAR
jgi:thiamine-monophosphate kinase